MHTFYNSIIHETVRTLVMRVYLIRSSSRLGNRYRFRRFCHLGRGGQSRRCRHRPNSGGRSNLSLRSRRYFRLRENPCFGPRQSLVLSRREDARNCSSGIAATFKSEFVLGTSEETDENLTNSSSQMPVKVGSPRLLS